MKKVVLIVLLLVLAWTSSVHASETLFQKSTTNAEWPAFATDLQTRGLLQDGMIETTILTRLAYHKYREIGGNQPFEAFASSWLERHGLGARISVAEFRARAQAGHFTTATSSGVQVAAATHEWVNEVAFAAPAGRTNTATASRTSPSSTPTPPSATQTTASVSPEEVRALRSQLGQLRTEVGSLAASQENDALASQVAALDEQLSTVVANQSQYVTDEQFQADLAEVIGQVDSLIASQSNLVTTSQLTETVSGIQSRLATLEAAAVPTGWSYRQIAALVIAAAVIVLLLLLVRVVWRRRHSHVALAAQSDVDTAPTTEEEDDGILSPVRLVTNAGQAVPKTVSQKKRDIVLPEQLSEQLQQLSAEQSSIQLPMMVDGVEYQLRFSYVKPGYVSIDGITSQTREVKIAGIQSVLKRAAGHGRVHGLSERQTA